MPGLTSQEAQALLKQYGPNTIRRNHARIWDLLWRQLRSPLLLLLAVTAAASYFLGEKSDAIIIGIIVALSVGLGFVNEFQAAKAADDLAKRISHKVTVWRDGQAVQLPATELVPGDVIDLHLGDIVPADLQLTDTISFECDESMLTGESLPVQKDAADEKANTASMGTIVHSGSARATVTRTGGNTAFGKIATGLDHRIPPTSFQKGLTSFSMLLVQVAGVLTVAIFVINLVLQRPLIDALLFALAIAVGISPQLLPAVVSTSLTQGARRLAKRKVLVKRLVAIEDLGDIEVLFTDKTGTLTEGQISFSSATDAEGIAAGTSVRLALACSDITELVSGEITANPLDLALATSQPANASDGIKRIAELPFNHDTRSMTVLGEVDGVRQIIIKGAPEHVFECCSLVPEEFRAQLDEQLAAGRRVIVVAAKPSTASSLAVGDDTGLTLQGMLVFLDPPKASAADSLRRLADLGITTKIITGDSPVVAEYVCDQLGVPAGRTLTGKDLDGMSDVQLTEALAGARIFARVSPEQKARIVRVERQAGKDVAFMGDGVNDALAIHEADVGISVDSGTDVAKDAADAVLLERDLHVLADGVMEGRRIFANTTKYILMGTSSNFGNMFSAAAASAFLPFLPMLPGQILLNNLLYDASQMAIPSDRVDPELLARPSSWNMSVIRRFMLLLGPISSLFDFLTFAVMLKIFAADPQMFRSGWFVESLATQTLVVFIIRTRRRPFFRSRPGIALSISVVAVVIVGALIPQSWLGPGLGFAPLSIGYFGILAAMVLVYLVLVDALKRFALSSASGNPPTRVFLK